MTWFEGIVYALTRPHGDLLNLRITFEIQNDDEAGNPRSEEDIENMARNVQDISQKNKTNIYIYIYI